jgi:hypothetical protein
MASKADENRRNAYTRSSARKKVEEYAGGSDSITYDLEKAGVEPFVFPHPLFYTEEQRRGLEASADATSENDIPTAGRVLLGEAEYERFLAAGGTDDELNIFQIAVSREMQEKQGPTPRG